MWLTFAPSGGWCEAWLLNGRSAEREKLHVTARNKNRHYSSETRNVKIFNRDYEMVKRLFDLDHERFPFIRYAGWAAVIRS
jgi:hypothetical protein